MKKLFEEVECDCFGHVARIDFIFHRTHVDSALLHAALAHMGYREIFGKITPNIIDIYRRGLFQDWSSALDKYAHASPGLFPHEVMSRGAGENDVRSLAAFSLLDRKCFSWIVLSRRYNAGFKLFARTTAMDYAWRMLSI